MYFISKRHKSAITFVNFMVNILRKETKGHISIREEGKEEEIKRIKMRYVHVPTPHNRHNHYVLQTCANKN